MEQFEDLSYKSRVLSETKGDHLMTHVMHDMDLDPDTELILVMEVHYTGEKLINLQLRNKVFIMAQDFLTDLRRFLMNPFDGTNTKISRPLCNNWPQWLIKVNLEN